MLNKKYQGLTDHNFEQKEALLNNIEYSGDVENFKNLNITYNKYI